VDELHTATFNAQDLTDAGTRAFLKKHDLSVNNYLYWVRPVYNLRDMVRWESERKPEERSQISYGVSRWTGGKNRTESIARFKGFVDKRINARRALQPNVVNVRSDEHDLYQPGMHGSQAEAYWQTLKVASRVGDESDIRTFEATSGRSAVAMLQNHRDRVALAIIEGHGNGKDVGSLESEAFRGYTNIAQDGREDVIAKWMPDFVYLESCHSGNMDGMHHGSDDSMVQPGLHHNMRNFLAGNILSADGNLLVMGHGAIGPGGPLTNASPQRGFTKTFLLDATTAESAYDRQMLVVNNNLAGMWAKDGLSESDRSEALYQLFIFNNYFGDGSMNIPGSIDASAETEQ
jgi:hypothetical protein